MSFQYLLHSSLRTQVVRLLPILFILAVTVTVSSAQANFAGTSVNVETWTNAYVSGIAVSPHGDLDICNSTDGRLYEAPFTTRYEFSYFPDGGADGVCPTAGPATNVPMAEDAGWSVYFLTGNQVVKRDRGICCFSPPLIVADNLNLPTGIVLDTAYNIFVAVAGDNQVVKIAITSTPGYTATYAAPVPVLHWTGIRYVAIDAAQSVYAAGGYGASSGFVVKATWNGAGYDPPVLIASGLNDITGLTADPSGNVFVSSDDNYETPLSGETYSPAAIVDLFEIPFHAGAPYGPPIPLGNGSFYLAQTITSDAAGNLYLLWIGGPRGSVSYNVEKVDPHNLIDFGSVKTDATSQRPVPFWITGTELQLPSVATSTSPASALDFITPGSVSCDPDAGIPLNTDGYPVLCSATVTFHPAGLGARTGAALLISGGSGNTLASANLTGIGLPTYDADVTVSLSNANPAFGTSIVVTLSVYDSYYAGISDFHPAPTGTVTLNVDGAPLVTLPLAGSGNGYASAYYILKGVAAGPHTLTATYSGGGGGAYQPGTSGPVTLQVLPAPVTLAVSCQNPTLRLGASLHCGVTTAPIRAGSSTSITWQFDSASPVSVPLTNGAASFTIPTPTLGQHTLVVSYAAQGNYAAATPVTKTILVNPAP